MEPDIKTLKNPATKNDDERILEGDCIEIVLETQGHTYYHLAFTSDGRILDVDREGGKEINWSSGVEVATHIGKDYWSLEAKVTIAGGMQEDLDPLYGISGRPPSSTYPWFFNICRRRPRGNKSDIWMLSPTGELDIHIPDKFAIMHLK